VCSFAPGPTPVALGSTTLVSNFGPAVFNYLGTTYSFGFLSDTPGSLAYAELNPAVNATDCFAFYQVSSLIDPPSIGCATFGYIYNGDSGLFVTANKTENAYPKYQGGALMLEPCQVYNQTQPPADQLFCSDSYTDGGYFPYQCMLFFGETALPDPFYGPTYGNGSMTESTVMIGGGDCIFLSFPYI
jgi:hypothetical protein